MIANDSRIKKINFIKEIKALGYKVKLDTNGTHPDVIKDLLKENYESRKEELFNPKPEEMLDKLLKQ